MEKFNFDINELLQSTTTTLVFKRGKNARFYSPFKDDSDFPAMALKEINRMISLSNPKYRVTEAYVLKKIEEFRAQLQSQIPPEIVARVLARFDEEMIEIMAYFNMLIEEKDFDKQLQLKTANQLSLVECVFNALVQVGACYPPIKIDVQSDKFSNMRKAILVIPREEDLPSIAYDATSLDLEMESYAKLFLMFKNDPFVRSTFIDQIDQLIIDEPLSERDILELKAQIQFAARNEINNREVEQLKAILYHHSMQNIYKYLKAKTQEIWKSNTIDEVLTVNDEENKQLFIQNLLSQPLFMNDYPYDIQVATKG